MSGMFLGAASFNGDISKWDVSSVEDMSAMFWGATFFNRDISKWDVSSVIEMARMLSNAQYFASDISKWDVSSVTEMESMFSGATMFNFDISKWDVSRVSNMNRMFADTASFNQNLCGYAWVNSKATKKDMFVGSSGSIPSTVCETTALLLQSRTELRSAVGGCLKLSPAGDCSDSVYGPIAEWDVSMLSLIHI